MYLHALSIHQLYEEEVWTQAMKRILCLDYERYSDSEPFNRTLGLLLTLFDIDNEGKKWKNEEILNLYT